MIDGSTRRLGLFIIMEYVEYARDLADALILQALDYMVTVWHALTPDKTQICQLLDVDTLLGLFTCYVLRIDSLVKTDDNE
jgi:hypothetical protein